METSTRANVVVGLTVIHINRNNMLTVTTSSCNIVDRTQDVQFFTRDMVYIWAYLIWESENAATNESSGFEIRVNWHGKF